MIKYILTFFAIIVLADHTTAQRKFQLTIKLDSSLIGKKIRYQYDNGKRIIVLNDSVNTSKTLKFKGEYYSTYVTLDVLYVSPDNTFYLSKYLIGSMQSEIDLYFQPNADQLLFSKRLINARAIYDTSTNKTYRELVEYNKKENLEVYEFTQKNKFAMRTSDSLQKIYRQMLISVNNRTLNFLRKHAADYFSFWYFQHEIAASVGTASQDTTLLREQLNYFQSTFPKKYTDSFEGREMISSFKRELNPLKHGNTAPDFSFKTTDGKDIQLHQYKGKAILLDFWATWCAPCMKEIPFVKSLIKKYPENKLQVIGISVDRNYAKLEATLKELQMNWPQLFDKNLDLAKLYGVTAYPTYFLLDQDGKIIYTSNNINNDESALITALDIALK